MGIVSIEFYRTGWRPLLGWVSSIVVICSYVLWPLLNIEFDVAASASLVALILGQVGIRTWEKTNAVPQ